MINVPKESWNNMEELLLEELEAFKVRNMTTPYTEAGYWKLISSHLSQCWDRGPEWLKTQDNTAL